MQQNQPEALTLGNRGSMVQRVDGKWVLGTTGVQTVLCETQTL